MEAPGSAAPPGHWLWGHVNAFRSDPLALLDSCPPGVVPLRLGVTAFLVTEPRDIVQILEKSETHYGKGRAFRYGRELYGNSLLVSEGAEHRRQVKQIGGLFFRHARQAFLAPAAEVTRRWLRHWAVGEPRDLFRGLVELTLAISSQAIFGDDYLPSWYTGQPESEADGILACYDIAMGHVARQNFSLLPLPTWVPTAGNRRYLAAVRRLDAAFAASVERRLAGKGGGGFLDHLLDAHRNDPAQLSLREVRDQTLILTLGGYESTATALCWTLLLLERHAEVRGWMQEELADVLQGGLPEQEQLDQLARVGHVFSESLRLYPSPWLIPRTVTADDRLPSGTLLRRGAQVFLSPYRTQRDPRFFPSPLAFNPGRFAAADGTPVPGSYFPFGLGPRHCLGEGIARQQAQAILATIYGEGKFRLGFDGPLPRPRPLLTLRPPLPCLVRPVYRELGAA